MAESDAIYWTLSSLFQGMCALYGLILVYYVYAKGKLDSRCDVLMSEYRSAWEELFACRVPWRQMVPKGSPVKLVEESGGDLRSREEAVRKVGGVLLEGRKIEKQEKVVLGMFLIGSVLFVCAGIALVVGLSFEDHGVLLQVGSILGMAFVSAVGVVLIVLSSARLRRTEVAKGLPRVSRTSARSLVYRGYAFYEKDKCLSAHIPRIVESLEDFDDSLCVDMSSEYLACVDIEDLRTEWEKLKGFSYGL